MIDLEKEVFYKENSWIVRRSLISDIEHLSNNMSKENIEEIWMAHHLTPDIVVDMAVRQSILSITIEVEGKPVGIFGIRNPEERKAEIFFIVTDEFSKIGRLFLRHAREYIDLFLGMYPYLDGHVYTKNVKSMLWMKYCGAVIEEPIKYGVEGKLFSYFYFKK